MDIAPTPGARYFQPVQASPPMANVREHSRRQRLADKVLEAANDTSKAVATVRAFDRTGNIINALDHLVSSAESALAAAKALADDIREKTRVQVDDGSNGGIVIHLDAPPPVTPLLMAQAEFNRARHPQTNA